MQNPWDSVTGCGNMSMDSFSSPSSTNITDWSRALLRCRSTDSSNYQLMLQEDPNLSLNYNSQDDIEKAWILNKLSNIDDVEDTSSLHGFQPRNLESKSKNSIITSHNECKARGGLYTSFPLSSASYMQPTVFPEIYPHQPQEPFSSYPSMDFSSSTNNDQTNLIGFSSSSSVARLPFLLKFSSRSAQQHQFTNITSSWNTKATVVPAQMTQPQSPMLTFEQKPNFSNLNLKQENHEVLDSGMVIKKGSSETAGFKRPRVATGPSTLPTLKVKTEKMGDRITALQQLVSPFGKTDTASVLHETIESIKCLHDHVSVLSTPYMKKRAPIQHQQIPDLNPKDLRSRGLCLVPISRTFPVTVDTTPDFSTPALVEQYLVSWLN